jgi:hypothetical protein
LPLVRHVGDESRYFFRDVDLGRKQGQFLLDTLGVGVEPSLTQAGTELFHVGIVDRRNARHHPFQLHFDALAALFQDRPELLALASARRREFCHRLAYQLDRLRRQRLRIERRLGQHARPTQNLDGRQRRAARGVAQHFGRCVAQLRDAVRVDRKRRCAGRRPGQCDPAVDLAPLELSDQDFAHRSLEHAQFVGQTQLQVEVAVIDRPQLDAERAAGQLSPHRREAGHAQDHGLQFRYRSGEISGKVNEIFTLCAGLQRM